MASNIELSMKFWKIKYFLVKHNFFWFFATLKNQFYSAVYSYNAIYATANLNYIIVYIIAKYRLYNHPSLIC